MAFTPYDPAVHGGFTSLGAAPAPTSAPVQDNPTGVSVAGKPLVGGLLGGMLSHEIGFGKEIGAAVGAPQATQNFTQMSNQQNTNLQTAIQKVNELKAQGIDTSSAEAHIKQMIGTGGQGASASEVLPAVNDTPGQVLGNAAGTALDIASFGSYGKAASGASFLPQAGDILGKSGQLTKALPVAAVAQATKLPIWQTLKNIATKTAGRSAVGGAAGYGYDVSNNLSSGKTGGAAFQPGMGTLLGATVPLAIGGVQAGVALTKESAPRFINSLVKPSLANFAYGKDPGKTVSEMGITGNSLPDFAKNLDVAKQDVGAQIGAIISSPENAGITINATPEVAKIDAAIQEAAAGGKSNQSIVTALQNAKDALLYEHQVNADGVIEKTGTVPRDLSALSPQEAFDLKQLVASQTKFTGNPSDDKAVNAALQRVYGGIGDKLTSAVSVNNPEIIKLNEQYGGLTSAVLATTHRDQIVSRSNLISAPIKVGAAAGIITAVASGGAAIPAMLASVGAGVLDEALGSTAAKTRIASWLGSQSPSTVAKILQQNPAISTAIFRLVPKLASQFGQTPPAQ